MAGRRRISSSTLPARAMSRTPDLISNGREMAAALPPPLSTDPTEHQAGRVDGRRPKNTRFRLHGDLGLFLTAGQRCQC